jgi:ubiquinone/menaquinone biosynthesis C-methylase UbiE
MPKLDKKFYKDKSWGAVAIKDGKDLPTLKLGYVMDMLRKRKKRNASLLEVGSGSGRILTSIRARDPYIKLTGIDLSREQTALAKKANKGKHIDFIQGNGEALPFADNTFDFVIFLDYLEHIEQPEKSLAEMYRVLKKGGQLHFVCPAEEQSYYWLSKKIFRRHFKEQTAGHIQQYTRRRLELMTQSAGFKIIDEKFSYHVIGGAMDYALFTAMLNKAVHRKFFNENKYYAKSEDQKTGIFSRLLEFGNAIAYYESKAFKNMRLFATAVHITARK